MANEFYALMGRMRYITRWGLMRNTFSENISEHSHQVAVLAHALALYSYECQVIALLLSSIEPYSLYPPCVAACANRPVIGIVTQTDQPHGDVERAHKWLELAGCKPIFHVSSYTGEGIWELLNYLKEPGDVLPWDNAEEAEKPREVLSDKHGDLPPSPLS